MQQEERVDETEAATALYVVDSKLIGSVAEAAACILQAQPSEPLPSTAYSVSARPSLQAVCHAEQHFSCDIRTAVAHEGVPAGPEANPASYLLLLELAAGTRLHAGKSHARGA